MLRLENNSVHLWSLATASEAVLSARANAQPESWLTERELARYHRLQVPERRQSYLLGKVFMRLVLSRYGDVAPTHWSFTENSFGKPFIDAGQLDRPLYFNLSHSRDRLVLAVSRCEYTGVDVEYSSRKRRVSRLASRYFSSAETDWLLSLSPSQQQQAFYQLWTLKEAYIKARGMGLALALDSFGFDLAQPERIGFQHYDQQSALQVPWRFWRLRDLEAGFGNRDDRYDLALGVAVGDDSSGQIDTLQLCGWRLHGDNREERVTPVTLAATT